MIRSIFLILCLSSFYGCKTQDTMPMSVEKIELVSERGIQYRFPDIIEKSLKNAIKKEENDFHFIKFSTLNDSTYSIILYCLNNSPSKEGMKNALLIKKTGRYFLYESKKVPIIFDIDYKFSSPGFVITHFDYKIIFKMRNNKGIILQEE